MNCLPLEFASFDSGTDFFPFFDVCFGGATDFLTFFETDLDDTAGFLTFFGAFFFSIPSLFSSCN